MAQYSTKMIFAVLDVSLIMRLNIGETDKVFFTLITITISRHQTNTVSTAKECEVTMQLGPGSEVHYISGNK